MQRTVSARLAGPVEATALGNVLVQARTLGADLPDLAAMRSLIRGTYDLVRYEPGGDEDRWAAAEALTAQLSGAHVAPTTSAPDRSVAE